MRTFFLSIIIVVTCADFLFSQSVSINTAPIEKGKLFDKLLGKHDGKYYCAHTGDSYLYVTVLDSQFNKIKEADLSLVVKNKRKYKVFNYLFLNDRFYVFYFDDRDRTSYLMAGDIDFSTLELKDSLHAIATMKDPPRVSSDPELDALWRFDIHYSPDGSYFVVNYMEDKSSRFVVYNSQLEKQYSAKHSFYLSQYFQALQISNNGTVVLIHKTVTKIGDITYTGPQPWKVVVMRNGIVNEYFINDQAEYKLFRALVGFTENDRPFVIGYIWHYERAANIYATNSEVRNVGTYYFSPGINNDKIKFELFPIEFLVENKSEKTKGKLRQQHDENKPVGAEGIYDSQMFMNPLGRIYLVGEENTSNGIGLGLGFTVVGQNSVTTVRTEGNPNSFLGSLLVTQFDSMGNILANTWVLKYGVENMYTSYRAIATADTFYVIFNDNYLNVKDKPADESMVQTLRPIVAGIPVVMAISNSGEKKQSLPFPDKDYSTLVMLNAIPIDSNTLLFQRKKFSAAGFEFCLMNFPN